MTTPTSKTHEDHQAKARELWTVFDANERHCIRFGMFPHQPMKAAEAEGYDMRRLTIALMDVASLNGGMRA